MLIFQFTMRKFVLQTWLCSCQRHLCLFHIVYEFIPSIQDQGKNLVLPNRLLCWVISTSDRCFVSVGGTFTARVRRVFCPPHRGSWRCRAVGTAGWSERWWGRRRRSEWRSRSDQEQRSQPDDTCACNVGWMRTWALPALEPMQCANIWRRTNSQGTLTLTTRKRDYKNKQAKLWLNPQRPRVMECTREFPHAPVHCACCCACRSVFRVTHSIVVNASNLFTFWPVREFFVEIHTSKMGGVV